MASICTLMKLRRCVGVASGGADDQRNHLSMALSFQGSISLYNPFAMPVRIQPALAEG